MKLSWIREIFQETFDCGFKIVNIDEGISSSAVIRDQELERYVQIFNSNCFVHFPFFYPVIENSCIITMHVHPYLNPFMYADNTV